MVRGNERQLLARILTVKEVSRWFLIPQSTVYKLAQDG